jgi:hypothetical protein
MQTLVKGESLLTRLGEGKLAGLVIYKATTPCLECRIPFDAQSTQSAWLALTIARLNRDKHLIHKHNYRPQKRTSRI